MPSHPRPAAPTSPLPPSPTARFCSPAPFILYRVADMIFKGTNRIPPVLA